MQPQVVFLAAAKVRGIVANNTLRAEFIYDIIAIAANVIQAACQNGAEKVMFLGSFCIYRSWPLSRSAGFCADWSAEADQRALCDSKIAGIKRMEAYRS